MKRSDSLEVQKYDSSDDDEMEDSESSARLTILSGTTPVLRVPLNWSVHPDMGRQLSNDGEETFRMGSIRCEISRMPFGKNAWRKINIWLVSLTYSFSYLFFSFLSYPIHLFWHFLSLFIFINPSPYLGLLCYFWSRKFELWPLRPTLRRCVTS